MNLENLCVCVISSLKRKGRGDDGDEVENALCRKVSVSMSDVICFGKFLTQS